MTQNTAVVILGAIALAASTGCAAQADIVPRATVEFQPLNPARGDKSPRAGVLWGDIRRNEPSGAIVQFVDGFASPPHIHNITYRGVVIQGSVHNDAPDASRQWMEPGSFWTQPAGESHITAASGTTPITIFLEILAGPYRVQPPEQAFDNGESPVNLDAGSIVWVDAADTTWLEQEQARPDAESPDIAFLWGAPNAGLPNGTFLRLPDGFAGTIRGNDAWLRAVVIRNALSHRQPATATPTRLAPGSYFGGNNAASHSIACEADDGCLVYISTTGRYTLSAD